LNGISFHSGGVTIEPQYFTAPHPEFIEVLMKNKKPIDFSVGFRCLGKLFEKLGFDEI
jgi:hypothetical protein